MALNEYPVVESVLAGIYGVDVGFTEAEAMKRLLRDLEHQPFRRVFEEELRRAFEDSSLSWKELFDAYNVANVDTEESARGLARKYLWQPAFGEGAP